MKTMHNAYYNTIPLTLTACLIATLALSPQRAIASEFWVDIPAECIGGTVNAYYWVSYTEVGNEASPSADFFWDPSDEDPVATVTMTDNGYDGYVAEYGFTSSTWLDATPGAQVTGRSDTWDQASAVWHGAVFDKAELRPGLNRSETVQLIYRPIRMAYSLTLAMSTGSATVSPAYISDTSVSTALTVTGLTASTANQDTILFATGGCGAQVPVTVTMPTYAYEMPFNTAAPTAVPVTGGFSLGWALPVWIYVTDQFDYILDASWDGVAADESVNGGPLEAMAPGGSTPASGWTTDSTGLGLVSDPPWPTAAAALAAAPFITVSPVYITHEVVILVSPCIYYLVPVYIREKGINSGWGYVENY
jgi:hypothetical protein